MTILQDLPSQRKHSLDKETRFFRVPEMSGQGAKVYHCFLAQHSSYRLEQFKI